MANLLKWALLAVLPAFMVLALSACEVGVKPEGTTAPVHALTTTPTMVAASSPAPTTADTPQAPVAATRTLPAPTRTPLPTPEPTWDVAAVVDPQELSSYRSRLGISWTGVSKKEVPAAGWMELQVESLREPSVQHLFIRGDFPQKRALGMAADRTLDLYLVGEALHTNLTGGWVRLPVAGQALGDLVEFPLTVFDEIVQGIQRASYEGQTVYNGIEVEHYSFDETAFQPSASGVAEIETAFGDVYIAAQDRYLVHLEMSVSGRNLEVPIAEEGQSLQAGAMAMLVDLSSINEPFAIEVPDLASEAQTLPHLTPSTDLFASIPVPPGAEDVITAPLGLISFHSALSPDKVATFYRAQMPLSRWDEIEADMAGSLYHLRYAREALSAAITVAPDSGTGETLVWISVVGE